MIGRSLPEEHGRPFIAIRDILSGDPTAGDLPRPVMAPRTGGAGAW